MNTGLDDAERVFQHAVKQMRDAADLYHRAVEKQTLPRELDLLVKDVLSNARSVLDYVAHEVNSRHGSSKRPYYPLAPSPGDFASSMKQNLRGVAEARPDIAAFFERHQPYSPGFGWLSALVQWTNTTKHQHLLEQTRHERTTFRAGLVEWNPEGVTFGDGVLIDGHQVDTSTQMPVGLPVQQSRIVAWTLEGSDFTVISVLEQAERGLRQLLNEAGSLLRKR